MSDEKADKTTDAAETGADGTAGTGASTDDSTSTSSAKDSARSVPAKKATSTSKGTSGNPAKAGRTATTEKKARRSRKDQHSLKGDDPFGRRAWRSPRFLLGTLLALGGIAWLVFYYLQVRPDGTGAEPGGPAFMGDLGRYNYLIGFGLVMLGLVVLAHKSTPLGRGRGVVVGMLGCFLVGLLWICTFYVITDDLSAIPVFNDLGQFNLMVGIAFMAVGFTFATKWE